MIKLTTAEQITEAGGRVLGLRYTLDEGGQLSLDEQRLVVEIATAALYRLTPRAEAPAQLAADDREVPIWLQQQIQESEEH